MSQLTITGHSDGSKPQEPTPLNSDQPLEAGCYWKAIGTPPPPEGLDEEKDYFRQRDIKQKWPGNYYSVDDVLLLERIDWVDDKAHTVYLLIHPRHQNSRSSSLSSFKMLVNDFLTYFVPEPLGEAIRNQELLEAQGTINKLQQDFISLQSDPAKFQEAVMKSGGERKMLPNKPLEGFSSVSQGMDMVVSGMGVAELKTIAQNQITLAQATSDFIKTKSEEISNAVQRMTPYFMEKSSVALARVHDVTENVKKILKGIESLDLYVGKDVHVEAILEGLPEADDSEPLVIFQRKLHMNEEMAVHYDITDDFDSSNVDFFNEAISKDAKLRDQILPAQRCIVLIGIRRQSKNYGDAFLNLVLNKKNLASYLLVRNGDNIYAVYSPVESHEFARTLFPLSSESDKLFTGIDGSNITFRDLDYTDKLNEHEAMALHYKRFLILMAGLDHRLNLFGKFYPGEKSLTFISKEFQSKYMVFSHDADDKLISEHEHIKSAQSYMSELNQKIQSGSRVACYWEDVLTKENAPGMFKRGYRHKKHKFSIAEAYTEKGFTVVDCPAVDPYEKDEINVKVHLDKEFTNSSDGYFVLDFADINLLRRYVYERRHRVNGVGYIQLFKHCIAYLEAEREKEEPTRAFLLKTITEARLDISNPHMVIENTIIGWRAQNRGKPLPIINQFDPKQHKTLIDQLHFQAGLGDSVLDRVRAAAAEQGHELIRLVTTVGSKWVAYMQPSDDDRKGFKTHPWVKRMKVIIKKSGIDFEVSRFEMLKNVIAEKIMYESDNSKLWLKLPDPVITRNVYSEVVKSIYTIEQNMARLANPDPVFYKELATKYFSYRNTISGERYPSEPSLSIPLAISKFHSGELRVLCMRMTASSVLGYMAAKISPEEHINFADRYCEPYYGYRKDKKNEILKIDPAKALHDIDQVTVTSLSCMKADMCKRIDDNGLIFSQYYDIDYRLDKVDYGLNSNIERCLLRNQERQHYSDAFEIIDIAPHYDMDKIIGLKPIDMSSAVTLSLLTPGTLSKGKESSWIAITKIHSDIDRSHTDRVEFYDFMKAHLKVDSSGYGGRDVSAIFPMLKQSIFPSMAEAIANIRRLYPDFQFYTWQNAVMGFHGEPDLKAPLTPYSELNNTIDIG